MLSVAWIVTHYWPLINLYLNLTDPNDSVWDQTSSFAVSQIQCNNNILYRELLTITFRLFFFPRWPSATLPKLYMPSPTATGCTWCTGTWSQRTWCSSRSRASSSSPTLASATGFNPERRSTPRAARWPTRLLKSCWGTSMTLPLWVSVKRHGAEHVVNYSCNLLLQTNHSTVQSSCPAAGIW